MNPDPVTRDELKESITAEQQKNKTPLDKYEASIIIAALVAITTALFSGRISETAYVGLMGGFLGYTFGRIFNHWQGKE